MTEDDARVILNLDRGHTPEQVREAYRDLVKVWHPDRFANDERLREKTVRRLQEINDAYALLQGDGAARSATAASRGDTTAPREADPMPHGEDAATASVGSKSTVLPLVAMGAALGIAVVAISTIMFWPQLRSARSNDASVSSEGRPNTPAQDAASIASDARAGTHAVTPPDLRRPESGTELIASQRQGGGSLVVYNQSTHDGVVALVTSGGSERAVYVRSGEQTTLANVAAGRYRVRMALGMDWIASRFTRDAGYQELEEPVDFIEGSDDRGAEYTRLTIALQPIVAGMQGVRATPPFQIVR